MNKKFNLNKNTLSVSRISVKLDWILVFVFWILVFVSIVLFSISIYNSVVKNSRVSSDNPEVKTNIRLNTEQLERVVSEYEKRQQKFDAI